MKHSPQQLQAMLDDLSPADVRMLTATVGHDPNRPVRLAVSPEGLIEVHQKGAGTPMKLLSFHQLAEWPKDMPAPGQALPNHYPEDMRGPDTCPRCQGTGEVRKVSMTIACSCQKGPDQ